MQRVRVTAGPLCMGIVTERTCHTLDRTPQKVSWLQFKSTFSSSYSKKVLFKKKINVLF